MSRNKQRESRSVDDPQSLNPKDTSLGVNNSHRIARFAHLACKKVSLGHQQHIPILQEDQTYKYN